MKDNKISVVINTFNAGRYLAKVLESVKGFDEVVVCDMESTDDTLQIAQKYGCRTVTFEKKDYNICEPARDFAIHCATSEWVLVVDADELVTPELREYLYAHVASADCPEGLLVARKNFFMGTFMRSSYPDYQLRFFRQSKVIWPPVIHSRPNVEGRVERIPRKSEELALVHLDENSVFGRLRRINEYTENEVERKWHKNYGLWAMFWRPFYRFTKRYVFKLGFLEGKAGLIAAVYDGVYQFAVVSKMIEKRAKKARENG